MTASPSDRVPPTWVARLTDVRLTRELGVGTFSRGRAYHRSGAVSALAADRSGRQLLATVRGSAGLSYQTVVTVEHDAGPGSPEAGLVWSGRCSCPMQMSCKHVVAALLAARSRWAGDAPRAQPAWEAPFAAIVSEAPEAGPFAPLALHLEISSSDRPRYVGRVAGSDLRLRPVTRGAKGAWVRTGVSWRELEYPYRAVRTDPQQRESVLRLMVTARTRDSGGYFYTDQYVTADQLGPGLWRLLREITQTGVPLVSGPKGQLTVRLAEDPATVVLDTRRNPVSGAVTVSPSVRVPGWDDDEGAEGAGDVGAADAVVGFVGSPPHGVHGQVGDRLLLAPIAPPLDAAMGTFVVTGEPVQVPAADVTRFLGRYYPVLRQRASVESSDGSVAFPQIRPPTLALWVRFEPGHQAILRWSFAYAVGEEVVSVPITGPSPGPARDSAVEEQLLAGLDVLDAVPGLRVVVGDRHRLVPEQRLSGLSTATFVSQVLPVLVERDDLAVTVEGTPLEYAEAGSEPVVTVSATDPSPSQGSAPGDWFDLGITVTIEGEQVPFAPLFAALARGDAHLILDSGTWFSLERPQLQALRRLIEEARSLQDREGEGLRVTRWQAGLWEELVSLGVVEQQSERWARSVGALVGLEPAPEPAAPAGLRAELRSYQLEGYRWLSLLWDHQLGGVLADDMGLGKTLQTLAMALRAAELGSLTPESPLLVVTPTSVVSSWQREAARFCPDLRVATVTETRQRSGQSLREATAGAHVVVTSFALLRLDEVAFRELTWSGLVLDEAQFVKNHQAKTYQVARRLPAPFKLAITGTPLENSLMDLWALLSIVAPGLFPSPQRFTETFRRPIESGQYPELLETLRRRIRPLMLRRTKDRVAHDLPPKIEQVLNVTLDPRHQRIYQTYLQRERQRVLGLLDDVDGNRIAILRSLTVLRQLSLDVSLVDEEHRGKVPSSKIDTLVEQLRELAAEGHRALVFSQFTRFLRLVRDRLSSEGLGYVYLDGRTRDRPARIAEFVEGDAPAFLISLKAGGSGLTLTEADYVFVLDPWWNPATEAQAVDRTHRIGQDKTVTVYRLVAEGTIEEKVVELQQRKRDLFDRVVEDGGSMGAPLSVDDIRALLGG